MATVGLWIVKVSLVALPMSVKPEPVFTCHCTVGAGLPLAWAVKVTSPSPYVVVTLPGCVVTLGEVQHGILIVTAVPPASEGVPLAGFGVALILVVYVPHAVLAGTAKLTSQELVWMGGEAAKLRLVGDVETQLAGMLPPTTCTVAVNATLFGGFGLLGVLMVCVKETVPPGLPVRVTVAGL
jgi:hypothetical protein